MSMDAAEPPLSQMKPQDTTNFLLGGMQKQLEGIALEQKDARATGESFRTEIRESVASVKSDVEVLKAKQTPRAPWYSVAAGIAGVLGGATGFIALLRILNP
jgi:hypothetical protein